MASPKEAVRSAQLILGVTTDGIWGPKTLRAFTLADPQTKALVRDSLQSAKLSPEAIREFQAGGGDARKTTFREEILPKVKKYSIEAGLNPVYAEAQLRLESAHGAAVSGAFNYGGIKARKGEAFKDVLTREKSLTSDKLVAQYQKFRSYESADEFAREYVKLLSGPKYRAASSNPDTKAGIATKTAYATDPQYNAKLASVYAGMVRRGQAREETGLA